MSLLEHVLGVLESGDIRFALIGAGAMAVHGVARSTLDIDLLTVDTRALDDACWKRLAERGIAVSVNPGDADDPLAGVVRFEQAGERPVDLVVGRHAWQARIIDRAQQAEAGGGPIPAAQARDLVLLKLYAGGAQDAWDIKQLLEGDGRDALSASVEADLADLPTACRELWNEIVGGQPL